METAKKKLLKKINDMDCNEIIDMLGLDNEINRMIDRELENMTEQEAQELLSFNDIS